MSLERRMFFVAVVVSVFAAAIGAATDGPGSAEVQQQSKKSSGSLKDLPAGAKDVSKSAALFAEYMASVGTSESNSREELEKMVRLVMSLKFVRKTTAAETGSAGAAQGEGLAESAKPPEAKQVEIAEPAPGVQAYTTVSGETESVPYSPVREETLRKLRALCQEGSWVLNPAAVGDTLFVCRKTKEAAEFYQLAVERIKPDEAAGFSQKERAWRLFQLGNCLYDEDRYSSKAKEVYEQFVSEYANSDWAPIAAARAGLIDWYQKNEPATTSEATLLSEAELESGKEAAEGVVEGAGNE